MRVNVKIVRGQMTGWRIVGDIAELVVIVFVIANAVFKVTCVPNLLLRDASGGEGISALDELDALRE
jgi:hypothetical protein